MAHVTLQSPRQLERALADLGREIQMQMPRGLQKAARFGATAVVRTSAKTKPRPKAKETYERSWVVTKFADGAALSNSAGHAIFVERGRGPSPKRPPPEKPIREWVYDKRLAKRPRTGKASDKGREQPAPGKKPKKRAAKSKKPRRKRKWQVTDVDAFVEKVRWKIAMKGFPGRWVLKRTMPAIAKRTKQEILKIIREATRTPPRGRS